MQLCALDADQLIFAAQAVKAKDYACLECGRQVRVRSGMHRQAHFYHLQPNNSCALHAKGMVHIQLQNHLKDILPAGEVHLEYRFPEIARIADVAWLQKRLIFEIQCSPITAAEVLARNASYASMGFQVVWIFHDARYNQKRLSAAEDALKEHPHYFSDMDVHGQGIIYDQFALKHQGRRVAQLPRLQVDPSAMRLALKSNAFAHVDQVMPSALLTRVDKWAVGFMGDSLEWCMQADEVAYNQLKVLFEHEASLTGSKPNFQALSLWDGILKVYRTYLMRPYRSVLHLLLERACR